MGFSTEQLPNRNRNLCEILFPKSAAFVVTYPVACLVGAEPRRAVSDMDIRHGRTSYRRIVIDKINNQLCNFGVQNEEEDFTLNIITDWSC